MHILESGEKKRNLKLIKSFNYALAYHGKMFYNTVGRRLILPEWKEQEFYYLARKERYLKLIESFNYNFLLLSFRQKQPPADGAVKHFTMISLCVSPLV